MGAHVERSNRTELVRRGIVVNNDAGLHRRVPLFLSKNVKRNEKKKESLVKDVELGIGHVVTAEESCLSLREIEECRAVFGEMSGVRHSDTVVLEDKLVLLGIPDISIDDVEAAIPEILPVGCAPDSEMCCSRFIDLVNNIKKRHLERTKHSTHENEMSETYQALCNRHGELTTASLAQTARTFNLQVPLDDSTEPITLQKFNTLLSSDHTKAEEIFIDLGGTPGANGDSPTGVIAISSIEQAAHLFGNSSAVCDVLELTKLLSGGELSFDEFKDLVYSPIVAAVRNPASISNVRSQLGLAKSLQKFVEYGVDIVGSDASHKDDRGEADKLFSLLKWCHWKDNKHVQLDAKLASGTLTQALNVILESHTNKTRPKKKEPPKPWRRTVAAGMRRLSTTNDDENKEALKRAALAMLLKRSVSTDVKDDKPKSDNARNLFLKGVDRAARRADKMLSHEGLLNMREARHDTAHDRGKRISKILHEVTAMAKETGSNRSLGISGLTELNISTPSLHEMQSSDTQELVATQGDPLTEAMTDLCTANSANVSEASMNSSVKNVLLNTEQQLVGIDIDDDNESTDLSVSDSDAFVISPTEESVSDLKTTLNEAQAPMSVAPSPPVGKRKKKQCGKKKPAPPTLDSIFEFIKKIPKPPAKPATKLRPTVLVAKQMELRSCKVKKPKVEKEHDATIVHTHAVPDWVRRGRGGGGIGNLITHALSTMREKPITM